MCFSHICYATHITGAEKSLLFLVQELQQQHDCLLVVPNEGILSSEARALGVQVIVHSYPLLWSVWEPGPNLHEQLQSVLNDRPINNLINLLHMHRPDAVIANTVVNVFPAIAAKIIGIPVGWVISEKLADNPYTSQSIDLINRHADWLIGSSYTTLAPFSAAEMQSKKVLLYPSWRMEAVEPELWHMFRNSKRTELCLGESDRVVGYISSDIVPHKGLEHFIRMALILCPQFPQAHFMIVGNPTNADYYRDCLELINQSGYASRFALVPFSKTIQSIYPAFDMLVIPSLVREGFGMTALEGLFFGKPVIAYRSGGLAEICRSTGNADYLVEPGDIAGLAARTAGFLADDDWSRQTGQRNSQAASAFFGVDAYRARLAELSARILQAVAAAEPVFAARRESMPGGILVKGISSPAVYLLEDGKKRPFDCQEAMTFYRYCWNDVIHVHESQLHVFPTGSKISLEPPFPEHCPASFLAKGEGRTIYAISGGTLHAVASQEVFSLLRFEAGKIAEVPESLLRQFPVGAPLGPDVLDNGGLLEGSVYRAPGDVLFYCDHGVLRKIHSPYEFQLFKWHEERIIDLTASQFHRFFQGQPIQFS